MNKDHKILFNQLTFIYVKAVKAYLCIYMYYKCIVNVVSPRFSMVQTDVPGAGSSIGPALLPGPWSCVQVALETVACEAEVAGPAQSQLQEARAQWYGN